MQNTLSHSVGRSVRGRGRGFTLIEVLFAIVLLGMAIAGLTMSSFAYTQSNGAGVDLTTAEYLIEQIHELTATMTVDQIYSFRGTGITWRTAINPPISADAAQTPLTALSAYSQQIKVEKLLANLSTPDASVNANFYRVTVQILKGNRVICSQSWMRARY